MKGITLYCLLGVLLSCQTAGNGRQDEQSSPKGYRLDKPERFRVRESMQEISGIAYNGDETHFLAINDEQGKMFRIDLRTKTAYPSWKFGKGGDYEDLVQAGNDWIVLKSNGHLYQVLYPFTDSTDAASYPFPLKGRREFEATYYDPARRQVLLICKACEEDKGQNAVSVYAFAIDSMRFDTTHAFQIHEPEIPAMKGHLRPSAAAIHPIDKRLYILAAINNLLVITDLQGKVLETHRLPNKRFPQPEGLAFAPNGDMYISNEGDEDKTANILKFTYQP